MGNISHTNRGSVTKLGHKVVWGNTFQSIQFRMTLSQGQGHRVTLKGRKKRIFTYLSVTYYCRVLKPSLHYCKWLGLYRNMWHGALDLGSRSLADLGNVENWTFGDFSDTYYSRILKPLPCSRQWQDLSQGHMTWTYELMNIALNLVQGHKVNFEF